jgi:YfiH family protein
VTEPSWIGADWPAPALVRAAVSTRLGGVSQAPYAEFNLAEHVGDDPAAVRENRARLRRLLALPAEPHWLSQVHGITVSTDGQVCSEADASVTHQAGQVCVVMTADCLPILFCDRAGSVVAAAHAGWRGLATGVIAETILRMGVDPTQLMAWLGPAIGPRAYEVGAEVRSAFVGLHEDFTRAFVAHAPGKWLMDLYLTARLQLDRLGLTQVYGGEYCTFTDPQRFYSYRRDGVTGRMASLIWLQPA